MMWRILLLLVGLAPGVQASDYRLVGEAELKFMFWSVYHSRLYSQNGSYEAGQRPLRMEIEYQLPVKGEALVQRTAQEWEHLGLQHELQDDWLQTLERLWPDLERDDVLTLEVNAEGVSTFYYNGEPLGGINDGEFAEQFLGIWLSPGTSRPEVREALLGEG